MPLPDLPPLNYAASQFAASRFVASKPGAMARMQCPFNQRHYPEDHYSEEHYPKERCSGSALFPQVNRSLKILLAEDNLTNQKLALRQLQILGYQTDVVANGQAAVDAVMRSDYDIVLMDCQMPVLNGFDATLAIRTWERETAQSVKPIVIIAMTASTLEQDQERAIAVGMNDYLMKPVHKETLDALLQQWSEMILMMSLERQQRSVATTEELYCELEENQVNTDNLHLNFDYLHLLSENTPEFELELLQLFVNDSEIHLKMLQGALLSQDFRQIEQIAHHLKGASANVGAMVMRRAAEALEIQASQQRGDRLYTLAAALEASLKHVHLLTDLKMVQ